MLAREGNSSRQLPQAARDARRVASELAEMLAVLVVPGLLLSGINLLFG